MDNPSTLDERQFKDKGLLLEELKKMPIVQVACTRTNVSRATYYRWRAEDKEFRSLADHALQEGVLLINDMSESQVISQIKNGKFPAMNMWLRAHHETYGDKLKIVNESADTNTLTPEQLKTVKEALKLARLNPQKIYGKTKTKKH